MKSKTLSITVSALLLSGAIAAGAQATRDFTTSAEDGRGAAASSASSAATTEDTPASATQVTDAQLCTMTVHEAWVASGRNEDNFFDLVKRIAEMSASKRGLTIPDDAAAGTRFGDLIKSTARRDPDQLLYAVVDRAVVKTATAAR